MPSKGTARYNWEELKKSYFASDIIEIEQFLRSFSASGLNLPLNKPLNGSFTKNTKGWRGEKEEMKKLQTVNATAKMADDPEVSKFTQLLIQAKQNAIAKVAKLIGGNTKITERDIPNIQKGIEICNLELGLATTISKIQGDKDNPLELKVEVVNWKL
jgi:hypothetical protein